MVDLEVDRELAVQVVLAADFVSPTLKSRFAWCLGMPQIPLPPLTEISVLTGRSRTYWPVPKSPVSIAGRMRGAGRGPCVQARAMLYSM